MKKFDSASIANALLWATAILASAVLLRGTQFAATMVVIQGGAAGVSILLVENALRKR